MKEVTKAKFQQLYENDMISEVFSISNIMYGKSVEGQAENSKTHEIVYCKVG